MSFFRLFLSSLCLLCLGSAACAAEPKGLYLTWQQDPTTTMTISWLTPISDHSDELEFRQDSADKWLSAPKWHTPFPYGRTYMLHRTELTGLTADRRYEFRLKREGRIYRFKTLAKALKNPLRFVVGGDMFRDELATFAATNRAAAATNPDFAVFGGDLAYAAALRSWKQEKPDRWVTWLDTLSHQMVTSEPKSLMIPMVAAIGNHDVNGGFGKKPEDAAIFYLLFPTKEDNSGYRTLDVADFLSIFLLDSGHTHPIDGKQTQWLEKALAKREHSKYKFACYHVPIWPSVRRDPDKELHSKMRSHWMPLFERYGLDAAFEHHEHTYKRTHRLIDGKESKDGVLYLGDGDWGVTPRVPIAADKRPFLAKTLSQPHFLLISLDDKEAKAFAISPEGVVFDQVTVSR